MPALSFRTKLLLAMMVVVVGVSGATLSISQRRFQESYQRRFAQLFDLQNRSFAHTQDILLENIKQACTNLVRGRRLQDALSESTEADELYKRANGELEARKLFDAKIAEPSPLRATFFVFLDSDGQTIFPPPYAMPGLKSLTNQNHFERQFRLVRHALGQMEETIVGYITPEKQDGQVELQQAIFTKVVDNTSDETLGALVLGFPMPNLGEKKLDTNNFKVAIFFEDNIYSQSVPESERSRLAKKLTEHIQRSAGANEGFTEPIGGSPHQIFYQALNPDPHFPKAYLVALFSLKESIDEQQKLRKSIVLLGGLGLIGALAMSYVLSHGLSVPIRELVRGTNEIQRGNFEVKVPVRSRDEIGRLATSFNDMAEGLVLKEKYRSVLEKVSDQAVAHELMQGNVALGGETREISVLFCDIRGFTALSQGMDPDEVIRMLNEHFTPLTRVVKEHNGVVDKFVGDLIMAIFGAPKSYGDDAFNAAQCALDMIHERQKLNETSNYRIQIGIGVASGSAVAGCMGSADRLNYTVLGERVNLASRLCGKAERMEVVIDQTTRERLGDAGQVENLPELLLKGFSAPVSAYKLVEIRTVQEVL